MRKLFWFAVLLWLGQAAFPAPVQAATPTPTPAPATPTAVPTTDGPAGDRILLEQLGIPNTPLHGPYDSRRAYFSLPAQWAITSAGDLYLSFDVLTDRTGPGALGFLEISLDNQPVTTVPLAAGHQTVRVTLPFRSLAGQIDNRHNLLFFLNAAWSCTNNELFQLTLRPESYLAINHTDQPPALNLNLFPWPLYQRSFITDTLTLVMPNTPSTSEIQAALTLAAGLGKLSNGNLVLTVTAAADLTPDQRTSQNLAFVGLPAAFTDLQSVSLPVPLGGVSLTLAGLGADDGVIQLARSPWNSTAVVLSVSGNTEAGLIKAARALSTGPLLAASRPDLVIIKDVPPAPQAAETALDASLLSLGARDWTTQGVGTDGFDVFFSVPADQQAATGATLTLNLVASTLAANAQSGLSVYVNGQPVGSIQLQDTQNVSHAVTLTLPPTVFLPGKNRLTLASELLLSDACIDPRTQLLWLTVNAQSSLHVPLQPRLVNPVTVADLDTYPLFLTGRPNFDRLTFVVPAADPEAWAAAAQTAFNLGNQTRPALVQFQAAFADTLSDTVRAQSDLVFVGRPSRLPPLAELGAALPAPFPAGEDLAQERGLAVTYRLPEGVSIGYLELLVSPWNAERALLVVTGNSAQGLAWANQALAAGRLRYQLHGNWAVINGEQIVVGETRGLNTVPEQLTGTAVPQVTMEPAGATPGAVATPAAVPPTTSNVTATLTERPGWLLPAIIGSAAGVLLVVVAAGLLAIRGRRSKRS